MYVESEKCRLWYCANATPNPSKPIVQSAGGSTVALGTR